MVSIAQVLSSVNYFLRFSYFASLMAILGLLYRLMSSIEFIYNLSNWDLFYRTAPYIEALQFTVLNFPTNNFGAKNFIQD